MKDSMMQKKLTKQTSEKISNLGEDVIFENLIQ